MFTLDQATIDSTGAFYVNELERLDSEVHEPLVAVTWGRDIMVREDVTIGDDSSSWTNSAIAMTGGFRPGGKSWAGKNTNQIQRAQLDIGKTVQPMTPWAAEVAYSLPELASAMRVNRPIDTQYYDVMKTKHEMDIDEMVYIGDTDLNYSGMFNNTTVTASNVPNGASASSLWTAKTPSEILADVNAILEASWAATGWSVVPTELRLPPVQFGYIIQTINAQAGQDSIATYLKKNSLSMVTNGTPLNIQAVKWLTGRGAGGLDRMAVFTKDKKRVRIPLTDLQKTPVEFRSLEQVVTYWGRIGVVEVVYPNTMAYADGL